MVRMQVRKKLHLAGGDGELNLQLDFHEGELVTLFGPSGAGKTTALRLLAGLAAADEGVISVGDEIWYDSTRKINLPTQRRAVGFVFQNYALFPNMTVRQNIHFGLYDRHDEKFVDELLTIMGLLALADRRPVLLSGGQQQRVALARAMARRPGLLLLDEPFSALDTGMRQKLQEELLEVHRRFGVTTVLVSHDLAEIFKLSGQVFVLEQGQLRQSGVPAEVFADKRISGKFKFVGEIIDIEGDDIVFIVTLLVGNNMVKVVATEEEQRDLQRGDKVLISSKAFNPLLMKVQI